MVYENSVAGEMPYHVVLRGSAVLETPDKGLVQQLHAGDIVMFAHGSGHVLHDGSGLPPTPAHIRDGLNVTFSENTGTSEQLEMLCGRFILAPLTTALSATTCLPASLSTHRPMTIRTRPKRLLS